MKKILIISVALFSLLSGLYVLLPEIRSWYITLRYGFANSLSLHAFSFILFTLLPGLKIASAIPLLRHARWAWLTTLICVGIDFSVRLAGAVNLWTFSYRHPEIEMPVPGPDDTIIMISMIPSYAIAVLSLVAAVILLAPSIRILFRPSGDHSSPHNQQMQTTGVPPAPNL